MLFNQNQLIGFFSKDHQIENLPMSWMGSTAKLFALH
jgi:hypothetical protein